MRGDPEIESQPTIVCLGEVLWDLFPDGERFGGAPANFACHAAIQGGQPTMISAVGDDQHGRDALQILGRYGIDTQPVQTADAPTGTVSIALDDKGKPTFTIHEGSAWDRMEMTRELAARCAEADAVYFGTLGQRSEPSRSTIRRCVEAGRDAGAVRMLDVNLRRPFYDAAMIRGSVERASILKLSDDELPEVAAACGLDDRREAGELLSGLRKRMELDLVVMTRGPHGALLATPDALLDQNGVATNVVDTVGAGDSFAAAFLIGVLQRRPHAENLRAACEVAAATCAHRGAVPQPKS